MKSKVKVFLSLIFIIMGMSYANCAWANDMELPVVKVALSDDQSIVIHRMMYEAVKRSGYQMLAQVTGMRTAIADVNYGEAAILSLQTGGWEKSHENLLQVPVVLSNVEFIAYTRSSDTYKFSDWGDMAGLRLGYRWQNEYVVNNIQSIGASKLVEVTVYNELWNSLLNNETDVVVLPSNQLYEHRFPHGIRKAGVIEIQPCYSYVNRKYADLLPLLKNAYEEMYADGTMALIHDSRERSKDRQFVLHINSYNTQIEWEHRQMESIRNNLLLDSKFEYRSIDLNSNELHSQASFNVIVSDIIRTDYLVHYPDLIIVSGNEALEFVRGNYYILFPQTPVVSFGALELDESMLYGLESYVTGVSETFSFHETISEMLRLYPKTREIYILNGYSLSRSKKLRESIHKSIEAYNFPVKFVFSEDKPLAEILEDIRGFGRKREPNNTLVLIGNYLMDSDGTSYSEKDLRKLVAEASDNPVFCMNASYIGSGTLGGLVIDTDAQSRMVVSMVTSILKGTPPAQIPVIFDSASFNQWQFDHNAIKKFAINEYSLPKNHIIVNRLLSIWETNPLEFRVAVTAAILLLLIISGLIVFLSILAKKQKEAQAASRAKSAFLANMSHEIRTPMNSIIGFSELALDYWINPKIKEYLEMIKENAKGLLHIINNILDISKVESGSVNLESIPFNLREVLESCKCIIEPKAAEKNVDLQFYAESSIGKLLLGDPTRLRQVLLNLLSNAVKFTDSGSVKLSVIVFGENKTNVTLRFEVEDSGIGMTDEQIKKIYEPFMQGDISTTRKYGGTGLGLTITKNILDLMGSKLEINSTPGVGTAMAFDLSFKLTEIADVHINMTEPACTAKKLDKPSFEGEILVCEDNQMNQKVITEHLARVGLNFEIAENGQKGIDMVRSRIDRGVKPFDLILMDVHMPVMDGVEAAAKIMKMDTGTPIVAMTANIMMDDREQYKAVGMIDYLGKPFLSQELWQCLLRHLKPVGFSDPSVTENEKEDRDKKLQTELKADFAKSNQTKYEEIQNAIDSGDIKLAYRLVHTLKSCAALIGKTALQKTAAEVEAILKGNENHVPEAQAASRLPMEVLRGKLSAVLEELRPYLIENTDPVQPEGSAGFDPHRAQELIGELEPLLKSGSPESLKMIGALREIPGSGDLIKQIEEFYFGLALEALAKLKEKLNVM